MKKPSSITHLHLANIINTEIVKKTSSDESSGPISILDVGCGRGKLLDYVSNILPHLRPEITFKFNGFDIKEHGAHRHDYLSEITRYLNTESQRYNWNDRITVISSKDKWPYADNCFDYMVSNQVFEHVMDPDFVFSEIYRCLKTGGKSINLFPVKEVLYEGHLHLPLAHKLIGRRWLTEYIKFLSLLRIGRIKEPKYKGVTLDAYARSRTDYLNNRTNYLPYNKFLELGRAHGLRTSICYTRNFYTTKIASLLNINQNYIYSIKRVPLFDSIAFALLKYISSITLLLEK